MDIEELDKKIQSFVNEMRDSQNAISSNQLALSRRMDSLDLNGTAAHLREFGRFLAANPDFMKREANRESERVREQIAKQWIAETFHLTNFGSKARWMVTALLTGVLLAFGTTLESALGDTVSLLHSFGHALLK